MGCTRGNAELILASPMFPHVSCPLIVTPTPRLLLLLCQRSAPKYRDAVRAQTSSNIFSLWQRPDRRQNIDLSCSHYSLGLILVTSHSSGPRTLSLCGVTPKICMQYEHKRKSCCSVYLLLWFVQIRWQAPRDPKDNCLNNRSNNVWELLSWIQGTGMRKWQGL